MNKNLSLRRLYLDTLRREQKGLQQEQAVQFHFPAQMKNKQKNPLQLAEIYFICSTFYRLYTGKG